MGISNVMSCISGYFYARELVEIAASVSRYHRIQGSDELEKAAEYIAGLLRSEGLSVEVYRYSYSVPHGSFQPLVGWWIRDAELWLAKPRMRRLHSFRESRTAVVAHSPGGRIDDVEVVYVGRGEDEQDYGNVEGKAVLAYGSPLAVYKVANGLGAAAVLLYRRTLAEQRAVPYLSLFLTPKEARDARALAFSVSLRTANILRTLLEKGRAPRISGFIDAGYREGAYIPVVTTRFGDPDKEVHITAHMCHPGSTVNDNVSGTATVIELALAYHRAFEKGCLTGVDKHSIRILLFPEYSGSMAYLEDGGRERAVFNANLDMVGEKQDVTQSTLTFVRPPPSMYHEYEALFYFMLRRALTTAPSLPEVYRVLSYRFDTTPYQMCSDHDAYLHNGVPAIMIVQWPDRFYHTDMDTIDKLDPYVAKAVGVAVGTAAYLASHSRFADVVSRLDTIYRENLYVGEEAAHTPEEHLAERVSFLKSLLTRGAKPSFGGSGCVYVGPRGPISLRDLMRRLGPRYSELRRLFEESRSLSLVVRSLLPLFAREEPYDPSSLARRVLLELGFKVSVDKLARAMELLREAGLLRCDEAP